ncbi:glycosyltransferase [Algibacter amylolyticus]|uniref:Glycosyltransferase n=1 Tax=Algibacter amylolyticus TaxID=1608400 RepID=A0A5M7AYF8_9FLAO|nr:glycosyltransferase [Algibacter amylolyticus]KAA5822426.1 glycosyltransferase [Algibacter amylolyticus]MBB5269148.1 glycosyltransferase involved in cell wall biosynthesis [Algibacter amylolyticus]TSJ73576.1 glycosyltransferase [Algibacter amylolyticus]
MRVLQLIDSLQTGGSERVAVNVANALASEIEYSGLCVTRKEGLLKEEVLKTVNYLFVDKKHVIDIKSIRQLSAFVKLRKIQIIHAHSSSFFLATIIKFLNRNVKVIWHDHYGNSEFLNERNASVLKWCSKHFSHVFSVNQDLQVWAKQNLKVESVSYLPNFATLNINLKETRLKGEAGKRVVCLANLRVQKDHFTLIKAFAIVVNKYPNWTLHCIGKDFNDDYSNEVKNKIKELNLESSIYFYDAKPDIYNILTQCEIGVLSSKSEGLPISLLEYGLSNLAVITTRVGECETVINHNVNGLLIEPSSSSELAKAIMIYIENKELRHAFKNQFTQHVEENYSIKSQIKTIINTYKSLLK